MKNFKRIFLVVLDSVGIGAAPDAEKYNDQGAHTLGHIADHMGGLQLPHLGKLGLSNIEEIKGVEKSAAPQAYYTKMAEASVGKDTMTGHWELMGLHINQPFQTFPDGFPDELLDGLVEKWGRDVIGNKAASGTAILDELGAEHMDTGKLIVYTSADSVLQIAAHEDVIPIEELYHICEIARKETLDGKYKLGRIIARPFIGSPGNFERTANRHDYALKPFSRTVMDELKDADFDVVALGKIADIFDNEGITKSIRTIDNDDGMVKLIESFDDDFTGITFLNLVDFDAKFGHRRDPKGYGRALEVFDKTLPKALEKMADDDLMIITADHGNDPTHHGTDHTREYVPLLIHHKNIKEGKELPIRHTFADVGATIADNFNITMPENGNSFLIDINEG